MCTRFRWFRKGAPALQTIDSPSVVVVRKPKEQLPDPKADLVGREMLKAIHKHFPKERATDFEAICACQIADDRTSDWRRDRGRAIRSRTSSTASSGCMTVLHNQSLALD
jgi:hypothetical protein